MIGSLPLHAHVARYLVPLVSIRWYAFGIVFLVVVDMQPENGWLLKFPQRALLLSVGLLALMRTEY
ncbi:hypothetical protein ACO0K0_18055 [Undibacterium sp. SXout11W]|uniref:hypothetical protein n=1 Tax=Undibacterium sp. SXout11W TaxID=3413050 RepID=UPI003BEF67D8